MKLKRIFASIFAICMILSVMGLTAFASETDIITISSLDDLKNFRDAVNGGNAYEGKTVTLTTSLDLSSITDWSAIGNGARSSKSYSGNAFKGIFDGGSNIISGLQITSTTGADAAVGLFGVVDGGTVRNLKLSDVKINVATSNLAGAAIGMMVNGATAENITVSGSVTGNDGVGGIVGRMIISGTITGCTNNADVTSSYGGIGGIVGKAYYEDSTNTALFASVTNCTNNGTITAPMYMGGIVGLARANVSGCINNGLVVGGTQTGGIIGQLIAAGTVSGNENNAKVTGKNHMGGIIGDYTQSNAYTYYKVTIKDNTNRGVLEATEQCAAIMGCNNIDGFTGMVASGNVSYYNTDGLELFGNPEDMVIDATNKFVEKEPVAKIGATEYTDLHEAMVACKSGETVLLISDVYLDGIEWEPVSFKGTFDGQNYTIHNLTINKPGVSGTGFITSLNGTFKNVTFTNPTVTGGENTGVVAGRAGGGAALAENITVNGTIKVETTHYGYARAGVIVGGWAYGNYKDITVDGGDKNVSYIKHTGGGDGRYVAGIVGHADVVDSYINCSVKNLTISGGWLCGGISGPGPSDGLADGCSVENLNIAADYSGGMFGWYYGSGTIEDSSIKNVAFTDGTTNNGAIGGYSANPAATVTNVTFENVTNGGKPLLEHVAELNGTYYESLQSALDAAANTGDTIKLLGNVALAKTLNINKSITLNGNGKTITGSVSANADVTLQGVLNIAGTYYVNAGTTTIAAGADVDCTSSFGIWDGGKMVVSANSEFSASSLYFNGGAIDVYGKLIATSGNDGGLILNGADDTINIHEGGVLDVSYVDIYKTTGNSIVNVYGDANVSFKVYDGSGKFTWNIIGGSMNVAKHGIIMNSAESKINVNSGSLTATSIANNGTINVSGISDIAAPVTGAGWVYMNGVTLDADTNLTGAKVRFASGTNNIDGAVITDGFFQVGIGAYNGIDANVDTENGVIVNVKNAKVGSNGDTYAGWIGTGFYDTDAEKEAAMTAAKYVLNIKNSIAEFGYMHISNDGELNVNGNAAEKAHYSNSYYSFYSGDFIINGTATFDNADALALYTKVSCDNGTDKPGTLNIENGAHYEAERHNGAIDGTNFVLYKTGVVNVNDAELYIGEYTTIAADAVMNIGGSVTALGTITNNGTINLTAVDASLTTPEAPEVKSAIDNYDVSYADGSYTLSKVLEPEILKESLYVTYTELGKWNFTGKEEESAIKLSLFAGVDSLNYNEVGFDVTIGEETQTFPITIVYDTVKTIMDGKETVIKAEEFGYGVNHIFGQTIYFPATGDFEDAEVRWTPYAIRNGEKITEETFILKDLFPGELEDAE